MSVQEQSRDERTALLASRRTRTTAPRSEFAPRATNLTRTRPVPIVDKQRWAEEVLRTPGMTLGTQKYHQRKMGLRSAGLIEPTTDALLGDMPSIPLKVSAVCVAHTFDFQRLVEILNARCHLVKILNEEVIFCAASSWPQGSDAFVFASYGSIVAWNLPSDHLEKFQQILLPAADETLEAQTDDFDYNYSTSAESSHISITDGRMILPEERTPLLDVRNRLSISYALATSVKLSTFESEIAKTIENARFIPEELASQGRIPLNKEEVSKKIGELYIQKSSVNLMYDILDAPDFFWDFDNLRLIYQKCRRMVDVDQRVAIVNMRLDVVRELLEILRVELSEQHSLRLELIVIWLIGIEVILGLSSLAVAILAFFY
eukprot:m.153551 g.153551  ORF g.153551 m.153551 type:complete len:375 (+) comp52864_c0_seq3:237-1361(+)